MPHKLYFVAPTASKLILGGPQLLPKLNMLVINRNQKEKSEHLEHHEEAHNKIIEIGPDRSKFI